MPVNDDTRRDGRTQPWGVPEGSARTVIHREGRTFYGVLKVSMDFVCALLLLILTSPIIFLAALAVKLTSRGPVFYGQTRLGRGGKPYTIHKIRSMVHNCENHSGIRWATARDPRITPVGRFLRATHIDELPQLWNVLRTEMSLVGPRPERPEFVPRLAQAIPGYRERLLVRPGITGLAQIQLPADTGLDSVRRKLAYDLYYIENMSFWMDLPILLNTACKVIGIPFALSGKLFLVAGGARVEQAYETAVVVNGVVPELQPA
jgi:lipopolysaccharide/colanic/teichoic acid biosynthesis glycosyltransferase